MLSTWTIVFGALLATYFVVGRIVYRRPDLTRHNLLTIGLALLALTSGVLTATAYHTTDAALAPGVGTGVLVLIVLGVPLTLVLAVLALTSYQYIPSES